MKIAKTRFYLEQKKLEYKKDVETIKELSHVFGFIAACAVFGWVIYIAYPKAGGAKDVLAGSALPYVEDYYPPDYDVPLPPVKPKPEWVQDNEEFNMQLEEALK